MTPDRLDEIRARHAAATPGPYRWRGYGTSYTISMASVATGNEVLCFRRWGFSGAQPVFCTDGLLYAASGLLTPDSAPHRKRITGIEHPDARALAHSWQDVEELLAEVDGLKTELAAIRARAGDDEGLMHGVGARDRISQSVARSAARWVRDGDGP